MMYVCYNIFYLVLFLSRALWRRNPFYSNRQHSSTRRSSPVWGERRNANMSSANLSLAEPLIHARAVSCSEGSRKKFVLPISLLVGSWCAIVWVQVLLTPDSETRGRGMAGLGPGKPKKAQCRIWETKELLVLREALGFPCLSTLFLILSLKMPYSLI